MLSCPYDVLAFKSSCSHSSHAGIIAPNQRKMRSLAQEEQRLAERLKLLAASETPFAKAGGQSVEGGEVSRSTRQTASRSNASRSISNACRKSSTASRSSIFPTSITARSPASNTSSVPVKIANRLKPDMFVLTGDYVSHETEYIAPVAEVLGRTQGKIRHSTPASATTITGPTPSW